MVGEHDTRLWRVIHHYVDEARANTDAAGVTKLATSIPSFLLPAV
jgi:hypothetical protein